MSPLFSERSSTHRRSLAPLQGSDPPITYDTPQPELRFGTNGVLEVCKSTHNDGARSTATQWVAVTPVRCFPWSDSTCFISLRDAENNELWLVEQLNDLATSSQHALLDALQIVGFLLEVKSVVSIEEDFEIRAWKVITTCGPRSFQTERDSWPSAAPGGGHMIQDVAGDVFFIPPLNALDPNTQKLLWPYVD